MTSVGAVGPPGWRDPDGAGMIGPDQHAPEASNVPFEQVLQGLNPLHHIPVVGMFYRMATGEQIPPVMRVLGALATGGPMGALGAGLMGLAEHILTLPPDQTRPALPQGMAHNDAGVQPVTPGEGAPGGYTTLATVLPGWLDPQAARAAYAAAGEWQRTMALERGVA